MAKRLKRVSTAAAARATDTPIERAARVTPCAKDLSLTMLQGAFGKREGASTAKGKPAGGHPGLAAAHQFRVSQKDIVVDVDLQLVLPAPRPSGEGPRLELVSVSAVFRAHYELASDASLAEADLEAFAKINSTFNVWPYWREFVQSATTRMGFPALTLPPLTIGRAVELAGYGTKP